MKRVLLGVAAMTLLIAAAHAGVYDNTTKCNPNGNQQEMNTCAREDYRAADAALNIRYGEVMKPLSPQVRSALRTEQRNWLKSRDPTCKREANAYEGGSMWPLVLDSCLARLTRTRTTELDRWKDREK